MGEFPQYPLAWCADDASWLILSRHTGIFTIADTFVSWRNSGINLSTPSPVNAGRKLEAWRKYLEWILTEFPDPEFQRRYRAAIFKWFPQWVMQAGECPNFLDGVLILVLFQPIHRPDKHQTIGPIRHEGRDEAPESKARFSRSRHEEHFLPRIASIDSKPDLSKPNNLSEKQ